MNVKPQFEKYSDGLVPAIVQDAATDQVLMLGFMSEASLEKSVETGLVTFYSRSRNTVWTKGDTSGNFLCIKEILADCDNDTLLVRARPQGPTCHLGTASCFPTAPGDVFADLDALIARRAIELPAGSYTTKLFESGIKRIAQKVGEEGLETALAALVEDDNALLGESADLLYHLIVLLRARGLGLDAVKRTLADRGSR